MYCTPMEDYRVRAHKLIVYKLKKEGVGKTNNKYSERGRYNVLSFKNIIRMTFWFLPNADIFYSWK